MMKKINFYFKLLMCYKTQLNQDIEYRLNNRSQSRVYYSNLIYEIFKNFIRLIFIQINISLVSRQIQLRERHQSNGPRRCLETLWSMIKSITSLVSKFFSNEMFSTLVYYLISFCFNKI